MDIQKEREEFEAEFLKQHNGLSFWLNTWCLSANSYSHPTAEWAWVMWKAAKAQAIPDGFVLMPKEPTQEMCNALSGNAENAKKIYEAIIKSQE